MAYEVLARKWRPQQFADVVGQGHVTKTLTNAIETDRVAHAYIFVGSRGTGKTTSARILAKALNCEKGPTPVPCDVCDSCKEIMAGNSLDVIEIDGASNNGVDQVRDLRDNARYSPARSTYKIYIIDEVHMLSTAAFNALLKTLEEPPTTGGGTSVILVTSSEDRLLATIRSRCQRVPFAPLSDDEVGRWLERHAEGLDDKTRRWIVGFAQGSVGRASLAVEYDLIEWGQSVLGPISQIAQAGRAAPHLGAAIADRVDGYAKAWVASHKNASKEAANRQAADLMGSMIANFARRQLSQIARDCDPEQPALSEAALEPWLNVIEAISDARRQLAANVNLTLVCEGMAMAIHAALLGTPAQR